MLVEKNDSFDSGHGFRSAKIMQKSQLLTAWEKPKKHICSLLVKAHDLPDKEGYQLIQNSKPSMDSGRVLLLYKILKDADALDRYRLGGYRTEFDFSFLRTKEGQHC